jgi:hypothetical protein
MAQQIIEINFKFKGSAEEYKAGAEAAVKKFAAVPGLLWKIWLMNEEKKEGGGIYLFADKTSVDNYRNSELFKMISTNPGFADFDVKQFDMLEAVGKMTNAPAGEQLVIL